MARSEAIEEVWDPDIAPNDLVAVCRRCFDSEDRREGIFAVDEGPNGVAVGRVLGRCVHSDSPPDFQAGVGSHWTAWGQLSPAEQADPVHVMLRMVPGDEPSWAIGRRSDALKKPDPFF